MPSQFRYSATALAFAVLIESLVDAPYTIQELVTLSGFAYNTTRKFILALHRRRLVYVAVWRTDKIGRYTKPAYSFGSRPDVPRPPARTATQRSANARLRAMTRQHDEATRGAPRPGAESKIAEEKIEEPSA